MAPKKAAAKGKASAKEKEKDGKGKASKNSDGKEGKAKAKKKAAAAVAASDSEGGLAEASRDALEPQVSSASLLSESAVSVEAADASPLRAKPPAKAATKSKAKLVQTPTRTFIDYDGPRPDQELLSAVASEIKEGDKADIEWIYELLRSGEDVNQRSELGVTSLAVAAAAGNGPLVSLLLERDADIKMLTIHKSELAIHHAVRNGNRVVCQLLAEPTAAAGLINLPNVMGWPPLHIACAAGHTNALNVLIRHGADINTRNELVGGATALHMAIRGGAADPAEVLLDKDAEVDTTDATGRAALHFAAQRADCQSVSLLLRSRADPLRRGANGQTALDCVPLEVANREKVVTLLQAYMRPPPEAMRADARFDKLDDREVFPNVITFLEGTMKGPGAFSLPSLGDSLSL